MSPRDGLRIQLRIDRLVLDGLSTDPPDSRRIGDAVRAELDTLLTGAPARTWRQSRRQRHVSTAPIPRPVNAELGQQVARSVYQAVREPGGGGSR